MEMRRVWAMPNKNTFLILPIKQLLLKHCRAGMWLDPYANSLTFSKICSHLNVITNDLSEEFNTDFHVDALEFLKSFSEKSCDGVVYDPPYSPRQISECYKGIGKKVTTQDTQSSFWSKQKEEIARIVKPNGLVLSFCWNSNGMGLKRGFEIIEVLLVPHGSAHNDTICVVERKIDETSLF